MWAPLRHPNILPLFGLVDDPAIPSTGIVTPCCTFGGLRSFFSSLRTFEVDRLLIVRVFAIPERSYDSSSISLGRRNRERAFLFARKRHGSR